MSSNTNRAFEFGRRFARFLLQATARGNFAPKKIDKKPDTSRQFEFESLPPHVIIEILKRLPFEDRINLCQVSQRVRWTMWNLIDVTKSIGLRDDAFFDTLRPESLSIFLEMCSESIERIVLPSTSDYVDEKTKVEWVREIAEISLPNLVEIDLGNAAIDAFILGLLVFNSKSLKHFYWQFYWQRPRGFIEYPKFESRSLESLYLAYYCNAINDFNHLRGSLPNLKKLVVDMFDFSNGHVLNDIYDVCPDIELLQLNLYRCWFEFEGVDNLWRLSKLRTLIVRPQIIGNHLVSDIDLSLIAASFPQLEELEAPALKSTNRSMATLATLENLRQLLLILDGNYDYNVGVRSLAGCDRLEYADFRGGVVVEAATIVELFQFCSRLRKVRVRKIADVKSRYDGARFTEKLASLEKGRKIGIEIEDDGSEWWIWPTLRGAVKKIEADGGPMIEIVLAL